MTEGKARTGSQRLDFLDGLRGVAALVVLLRHFLMTFLPAIFGGAPSRRVDELIGNLLLVGTYAVFIFFVLSGFVLAQSGASGKRSLPARLVARYLRLTIPMLVSLTFAWILLRCFPNVRSEFLELGTNHWLTKGAYVGLIPPFWLAVQQALYGVYWNGDSLFDNVVWTMKVELEGSVGIYLVYRFAPESRRVAALGCFLLLALFQPLALGFPLGALLREARARGGLRESRWGWAALVGAVAIPVAAHLLSFSISPVTSSGSAALLVWAVFLLGPLRRVLSAKGPVFLGRISFALYLLHVPLLVTVGIWSYLHLPGPGGLKLGALLVEMVALAGGLAWLMTIGIDEPLLRWLHRWRKVRELPRG
jgi:peptidoglycan/LPS O-acetylase OafA/YrhL